MCAVLHRFDNVLETYDAIQRCGRIKNRQGANVHGLSRSFLKKE
jgi:hypothetical protein